MTDAHIRARCLFAAGLTLMALATLAHAAWWWSVTR